VDLATGPGGGQGQYGLDGDVEARYVEGLEHDLGCVLAVLWGVERRLGEQEVVVLGLAFEVLEDALLPVFFHQVPVANNAVTNGVLGLSRISGLNLNLWSITQHFLGTIRDQDLRKFSILSILSRYGC